MNKSQILSSFLLALALFVGINIIANQTLTAQRLDLTSDRLFTLSEGSRNIVDRIDEKVTLRFYFSARQFADIPQFITHGKRVRDLLDEYVAESGGRIELKVIEPEPFSEAEDQAVGYGVQQLPISATGEMGYLGLVGTNATDDELAIPFLSPERADAVEYEITKLIYSLANPTRRIVGLLSGLPVQGGPPDIHTGQPVKAWTSIEFLKEFFELRNLDKNVTKIEPDIDTLLIIHPKDLPRKALYAIDQFVLGGGKAMVFVDPMAEEDRPEQDPANPMVMPKIDSNLPELFARWGISMASDQVVGDPASAVRVSVNGARGPQEINYLPWLQLMDERLNRDDFVTNELKSVNVGSAGWLVHAKDAKTGFTPLIHASSEAGAIARDAIMLVRDPAGLLDNFKSDQPDSVIAARITGEIDTAFPDGAPLDEAEKRGPGNPGHLARSKAPVNLIVVADTDLLADRFWVRMDRFLNMQVPNPFANNADFLINAIDNLGGNSDLISLRSRGDYARPFKVVDEIKREAEAVYRDEEQALQARLKETEEKLQALQSKPEGGGEAILSPEQRKEIELFRAEQLKTRKQLRAVQHDLQKNIEALGTRLKFVNIGAIPLLLSLFVVIAGFARRRRRA